MSDETGTDPLSESNDFAGDGVTVTFDAARCIRARECLSALPAVFDVDRTPWIQLDQADAAAVAQAVERCPSGALHYRLTDGGKEQPTATTRIEPQADGALFISGDLQIALDEGTLTETRVALCRCGRSGNKPFCDKTCERTGWSSTWHPPAG